MLKTIRDNQILSFGSFLVFAFSIQTKDSKYSNEFWILEFSLRADLIDDLTEYL
jgi:hypothetical protein